MPELSRLKINNKTLLIEVEYWTPEEVNEFFNINMKFTELKIPFFSVCWTKRTRHRNKVDCCDRLVIDKDALYKVYLVIKDYVNKHKPDVMFVGAYGDDVASKRIAVYDWFLGKLCYYSIYGDKAWVEDGDYYWLVRRGV
jgi:hypothetical protein